MKTATSRNVRFCFFPSATSCLCGMAIALGFVSEIVVPSLISPAAAQTSQEPLPAPTSQQPSADQLGGAARVSCLQEEFKPAPPQECLLRYKGNPSGGPEPQLDPETLRTAEDAINRDSWWRLQWQQDHLPLLLIPVPELF